MMTREKPPWNQVSLAADLYLQLSETEWNIQSKGKTSFWYTQQKYKNYNICKSNYEYLHRIYAGRQFTF